MGIALSTLSSALPHSLHSLSRWLHNLVRLDGAAGRGANASAQSAATGQLPGDSHAADPGSPLQQGGQRTTGGPRLRPLRGNWPFTVQPPVADPKTGAGTRPTGAPATRSFRSTPAGIGHRDAFMASISSGGLPCRSVPGVRKVAHASGRLVIAGRMADVCAELDRMAACEALQA